MAAREALDQPSEAVEDAKCVLAMEPGNKEANGAMPRLEAAAAAKLEKQKEEMMGERQRPERPERPVCPERPVWPERRVPQRFAVRATVRPPCQII